VVEPLEDVLASFFERQAKIRQNPDGRTTFRVQQAQ
jgi:hypothetical protein